MVNLKLIFIHLVHFQMCIHHDPVCNEASAIFFENFLMEWNPVFALPLEHISRTLVIVPIKKDCHFSSPLQSNNVVLIDL